MGGDTLTIAIAALAFIAGTLGAWLVYTDLRDSKRRFEARQEPYGDVPYLNEEMRTGQQRLAGGGHKADPSGSHNDIAHRDGATSA